MSIAFLIAFEKNPYSGVVRPFINWAKKLKCKKKCDVDFLLIETGQKIAEILSKSSFNFYDFPNSRDLSRFCKEKGYELIFSDDYIERLEILDKIRGDFRKAVYTQVLYGIHAISAIHNPLSFKEKLIFSTAKFIPFSIIRKRYTTLLKGADVIIANSQTTANLLHILYGLEPKGVVYPPLDTEVFKPHKIEKRDQVVLYLGSHAGDTDESFVRKILKVLESRSFEVLIMGNKIFREKLQTEFNVTQISDVSDDELARVYSRCKLVVCPQEWETFGYVPMESMLCGTPVLAFASQPFSELVQDKDTAQLVYGRRALLERLKEMLTDISRLRLMQQKCFQNREYLLNNVSKTHSANKLLAILS